MKQDIKNRRVTVRDIADKLNLSHPTVSRALNDHPRISESTKKKVREMAKKLNYRPNIMARALSSRKTSLIGFVIRDIKSSFHAEIIAGVQDVLDQYGYSIILCNSNTNSELEKRHLQIVADKQVEGIILAPVLGDKTNLDILVKIHEDGIPIVQVTLPKPTKDIPYVSVDNELGGYLATRHLLELGHRNIVYVTRSEAILKTGTAGMNENYDRYQGYCRALKEQGLLDNVQVMVDPTNGEDKEFILHIIKQKNPPTAVFAYCDDIAIGLIRGAHSNGFNIPDDISVVGFDDLPHAHMFQPPLTTVAQPKYELGTYAAQKLLQLISGKPEKDTILMPLMKIRESTAPFKKSGAGPRNPVVK